MENSIQWFQYTHSIITRFWVFEEKNIKKNILANENFKIWPECKWKLIQINDNIIFHQLLYPIFIEDTTNIQMEKLYTANILKVLFKANIDTFKLSLHSWGNRTEIEFISDCILLNKRELK